LYSVSINRNWFETCDCVAKVFCHQDNHILTDFIVADSSKVEGLLLKVSSQLKEAVANREEIQQHLLFDHDWLVAKLQAIKAQMEENNDFLPKLREAIEKCEGIKEFSQASKAAASTKKKLKKMLTKAENGLKDAQDFLSRVTTNKLQVTRNWNL